MTIVARRTLAALAGAAMLAGTTACTSSDSGDDASSTPPAPASSVTPGPTVTSSSGTTTSPGKPTRSPTGTVATGTVTTRSPVPISSPVSFGRGVTARITQVRAVRAQANLPGEISGPAVAVTIRLSNDSSRAAAIEPVVNLYYGPEQTPASTIDGAPSKPFGARLRAGAAANGTYTFTLGTSQRSAVRIEFSYTPTAPVVLWQGSVS